MEAFGDIVQILDIGHEKFHEGVKILNTLREINELCIDENGLGTKGKLLVFTVRLHNLPQLLHLDFVLLLLRKVGNNNFLYFFEFAQLVLTDMVQHLEGFNVFLLPTLIAYCCLGLQLCDAELDCLKTG